MSKRESSRREGELGPIGYTVRLLAFYAMLFMVFLVSCILFSTLPFGFASWGDERLHQKIESLCVEGADVIDLGQYDEFEWDRMHVFGPYTSLAKIENETGCNFPFYFDTSIEWSEHLFLVVFVLNGEFEFWYEERDVGLEDLFTPQGIARSDARFRVVRETQSFFGDWCELKRM